MGKVILLALSLWISTAGGQRQRIPTLPELTISDLPAEVRDQVREAYDSARKNPRDAPASGNLGMLLDLYHRPDEAAVCYQRAHQLDVSSFQWLYYLGSLQAGQGRHVEAARTLRAALRLRPEYLPARLKLAESLFSSGDFNASRQVYAGIVAEYPNAAEAYYGLGRIALAHGEVAAAAQSFSKACELFAPYGAAHYQLAQIDRKLGKTEEYEKQLALYAKNRTLVPPIQDPLRENLRSLDRSAASLLERGIQLEQAGRLEDAIAAEEKAVQLNPELMQAHVNLIILYGQSGDFQKAEEHYQTALKLNPDKYPDAYYNYGVLLVKEGKLDEAQAAFASALKTNPVYADAHNDLGYILERQGKLEEAASEYRKAAEERPDFRKAHFNLARLLVNQQRYSEAIEQLQQTLTPVDADTPSYLYALGAAYGRAGDHRQAIKYLQQAKDQAAAYAQKELLADINRDLQTLGTEK
ncbi:MAG TPA: tetratricopeptide repeat protein [Terriglobia bacterium]|nr:tetratricopeptide repeat protein [Terriglobia bacterium]